MQEVQQLYCKHCGLTYKTNYHNQNDDASDMTHLPEEQRHAEYNFCPRCGETGQVKVSMIERLKENDSLDDVHPNIDYYKVGVTEAGEM